MLAPVRSRHPGGVTLLAPLRLLRGYRHGRWLCGAQAEGRDESRSLVGQHSRYCFRNLLIVQDTPSPNAPLMALVYGFGSCGNKARQPDIGMGGTQEISLPPYHRQQNHRTDAFRQHTYLCLFRDLFVVGHHRCGGYVCGHTRRVLYMHATSECAVAVCFVCYRTVFGRTDK